MDGQVPSGEMRLHSTLCLVNEEVDEVLYIYRTIDRYRYTCIDVHIYIHIYLYVYVYNYLLLLPREEGTTWNVFRGFTLSLWAGAERRDAAALDPLPCR